MALAVSHKGIRGDGCLWKGGMHRSGLTVPKLRWGEGRDFVVTK